jgi:hypothetical protein
LVIFTPAAHIRMQGAEKPQTEVRPPGTAAGVEAIANILI